MFKQDIKAIRHLQERLNLEKAETSIKNDVNRHSSDVVIIDSS